MAGLGEGSPGDVKPAIAGEELVGEVVASEEFHKPLKLFGIARADVGCLADEVLRVAHTAHPTVYGLTAETGVDDDRPHFEADRLQQLMAAVGQICHDLHRGDVFRVFAQIQELTQNKMCGESDVIDVLFHGCVWL